MDIAGLATVAVSLVDHLGLAGMALVAVVRVIKHREATIQASLGQDAADAKKALEDAITPLKADISNLKTKLNLSQLE